MRKFLRFLLWFVGLGACGFAGLVAFGLWSSAREEYQFSDKDIQGHVTGRWDWSTRTRPCADSAHVISFSRNGEVMTIMQERSASDSVHAVLAAEYDVSMVTSSRIRGAIRGEKRLSDGGVPVVWELVMFGPDEYRWHRMDWARWGFTPSVKRCPSR